MSLFSHLQEARLFVVEHNMLFGTVFHGEDKKLCVVWDAPDPKAWYVYPAPHYIVSVLMKINFLLFSSLGVKLISSIERHLAWTIWFRWVHRTVPLNCQPPTEPPTEPPTDSRRICEPNIFKIFMDICDAGIFTDLFNIMRDLHILNMSVPHMLLHILNT